MKEKYKRLSTIIIWIITFSLGTVFMLFALKDNIVYFVTPTQLFNEPASAVKVWRLGGLVHNIVMVESNTEYYYRFQISDNQTSIQVDFRGIVPQLFRNEQGVVAEGHWLGKNTFKAHRLLIKHDETYRPPQSQQDLYHIKDSIVD